MRILLTGGTGFLGQKVVENSIKYRIHVVVIGRKKFPSYFFSNKNTTFMYADIADRRSLEKIVKKCGDVDTIVHLAAFVPKSKKEDDPLRMFKTNTEGTINLLEAFGKQIKSFVYASTAEIYGLQERKKLISEDDSPDPLSFYAASKLAAEYYCRIYAEKQKISLIILRFSVICGSKDKTDRAVPNFVRAALSHRKPKVYDGEELRDYLSVEDATQAVYCAAMETHISGVFNIGSGKGIKVKKAAEIISAIVDPQLGIEVLPREKRQANIVLDITRAKKYLAYKPVYNFKIIAKELIEYKKSVTYD